MYIVMKRGRKSGKDKPLYRTPSYSDAWSYIHKHFSFAAKNVFIEYDQEQIDIINKLGLFRPHVRKLSIDLCGRCGISIRTPKELEHGKCEDCIEIAEVEAQFAAVCEVPGVQ